MARLLHQRGQGRAGRKGTRRHFRRGAGGGRASPLPLRRRRHARRRRRDQFRALADRTQALARAGVRLCRSIGDRGRSAAERAHNPRAGSRAKKCESCERPIKPSTVTPTRGTWDWQRCGGDLQSASSISHRRQSMRTTGSFSAYRSLRMSAGIAVSISFLRSRTCSCSRNINAGPSSRPTMILSGRQRSSWARPRASQTRKAERSAPVVVGALEQAKRDLASLRLFDLDTGDRAWTVAAGLPLYVALFGRDTLTASWEAAMVSTRPDARHPAGAGGNAGADQRRLARRAAWPDDSRSPYRAARHARLHAAGAKLRLAHDLGLLSVRGRAAVALDRRQGCGAAVRRTGNRRAQMARQLQRPRSRRLLRLQDAIPQGTENQGWKDSGDAWSTPTARTSPSRSRPARSRASLTRRSSIWPKCCGGSTARTRPSSSSTRRPSSRSDSTTSSGWRTRAHSRWRSTPTERQVRSIGSNAVHCVATGIADKALVDAHRSIACSRRTCSAAGASGPCRPTTRPTIPIPTIGGPSGRSSTGRFAVGACATAATTRRANLPRAVRDRGAVRSLSPARSASPATPRDEDHPFPAVYPARQFAPGLVGDDHYLPAPGDARAAALCAAQHAVRRSASAALASGDHHLAGCAWPTRSISLRFFRKPDGRSDYEILEQRGRSTWCGSRAPGR